MLSQVDLTACLKMDGHSLSKQTCALPMSPTGSSSILFASGGVEVQSVFSVKKDDILGMQ